MSNPDIIQQAYQLALDTLRDRYTPTGIYAGAHHFSDVWTRDSMYASLGSLLVEDYDIVKTNLSTCMTYCRADGQVPLRVGQKHFLLKYLFGLNPKTPQARFKEDKGISIATDSNSLFIMVLDRYLLRTQDFEFAKHHFEAIKKIVDWNLTQDSDNDYLMEEGPYAGWADSIRKTGKVAYTNILHWYAYKSFSELCQQIGEQDLANYYTKTADTIKEKINEHFWNGRYFVDFISKKETVSQFSSDANLFAIIFGLCSDPQSAAIQSYITEHKMAEGFTIKTCHPPYPIRHTYPPFRLINMADYHNGMDWLWIGCVDVVAKSELGLKEEAKALLTRISEKIVEFNGVYEVYDKGTPVKRLFYSSEDWFAWSSGTFVWAVKALELD